MSRQLFVRAGRLIDGIAEHAASDVIMEVRDGRIVQVGSVDVVSIPPDAPAVDATDCTVLPGLVDAHVHIHTPGGPMDNYALAQLKGFESRLALDAYSYALRDLAMGYTAVRSLSSPAYTDIGLRDAIEEGVLPGPRIVAAGQGLRTQLKWGADVLKINPCVGDYRNLDRPWRQEMTFEEIDAICQEAHWAGKTVAAHTAGGEGITDCLRAGVDSLEHAHWLSDEQIARMVEQGTFYVPTLIVNSRSVELGEDQRDVSADGWAWLRKVYDEKWETLARAKAAGVKIAAGTDAGFVVAHGDNASEIGELVRGGFTPMEALIAATRTAAECIGLGESIGTLEPGKQADFVIVDGDPLTDVEMLRDKERIVGVYKDGTRVAGRP